MNRATVAQQAKTASFLPPAQGLLQRKCTGGNHTIAGGECAECAKNKTGLQRKFAIGRSNDPLEQEADRVAEQVMAAPSHSAVSSTPPRIQRYAGQATEGLDIAPASVDRVLSGSGRPLDAATQQDMGQRFGHDFSQVRVHSGAAAEQSAQDVNAHAYTVGYNLVFGAGQFAPRSHAGRRLLAHELAHVVQQTGSAESSSTVVTGKNRTLSRYRDKGKDTIAFDAANETLKDPKTQPWIDNITVAFDTAVVDTGHAADAKAAGQLEPRMPTGTLTAKYSTKSSKVLSDVVQPIAGGSTMLGIGLTDRVKDSEVKRLEGLGYMDSENVRLGNLKDPVAKTGKGARYSKSGAGSMNYAIFFKGIQAIHEGLLNTGSHACVHVGTQSKIRDINYHSRIGITTVTVTYDNAVLDDLCCHRKKTGNANWNTNPCEKVKCP
ncbi:eCIS core domain-containing protein [Candidatus Nitrotoga sp. AM1P]|uniref:eCIS core domain-containing protein n=1 Tax=Candidatus Nitrotoga sp. AM1P TaxID=2559597 RepID=UPI0010B94CFD|nr:DUF4157 domain-containing protein [Candidatus Nitrotoga sp. AM1P]BBJ23429.1 hypothetical protein W01_13560 [Candidatus Nitrotoga sp. AM1P]